MKVDQVMSRKIILIARDTPFSDLWEIIFKKRINAAPVVDKSKKLFGIITRDDMLRFLYPDYSEFIAEFSTLKDFEGMEEKIHDLLPLTAADMMCKKVIYTRTDTPIMRALSRMIVRNVNQLPVLDDNDKVVGIITKGDIFYALFRRHLARPKANKPKSSRRKT